MSSKVIDAANAAPTSGNSSTTSAAAQSLRTAAKALPPPVPVERRHKRPNGWRWLKERLRFLHDHPLCKLCEEKGIVTAAQEVDHIIPLERGGENKWSNYQALCRECHEEKTAEEQGGAQQLTCLACDEDGWPTDPDHPWNKR